MSLTQAKQCVPNSYVIMLVDVGTSLKKKPHTLKVTKAYSSDERRFVRYAGRVRLDFVVFVVDISATVDCSSSGCYITVPYCCREAIVNADDTAHPLI